MYTNLECWHKWTAYSLLVHRAALLQECPPPLPLCSSSYPAICVHLFSRCFYPDSNHKGHSQSAKGPKALQREGREMRRGAHTVFGDTGLLTQRIRYREARWDAAKMDLLWKGQSSNTNTRLFLACIPASILGLAEGAATAGVVHSPARL